MDRLEPPWLALKQQIWLFCVIWNLSWPSASSTAKRLITTDTSSADDTTGPIRIRIRHPIRTACAATRKTSDICANLVSARAHGVELVSRGQSKFFLHLHVMDTLQNWRMGGIFTQNDRTFSSCDKPRELRTTLAATCYKRRTLWIRQFPGCM